GMDTMEVFGLNTPAPAPAAKEGEEAAPAPAPKVRPEPPLVLLVPGTGVAEVFDKFEPVADGPVWKLKMPDSGKPGYAVALAGYVAMSPSKQAILFLLKAKPAAAQLDPTALTIRDRGDLVIHVN
ncbi:MAG: hypothetical protein NT031_09445, partial [Planctomycetota bacterium]|nr:hypothetical protein [Planctomycetota bacterium]